MNYPKLTTEEEEEVLKMFGNSLPSPPESFIENPPNPVLPDQPYDSFNIQALVNDLNIENDQENPYPSYLQSREKYLSVLRNKEQEKAAKFITDKIEQILFHGSIADLLQLYQKRHICRTQISHYLNKAPICCVDGCINLCLEGSSFCSIHILNDPNQKLFKECPQCHHPYPIVSECFYCSSI